MKPSLHLLLIDPQNDFCHPDGALSVPGAEEDMARLIELIDRRASDITRITVTLDSHRRLDISHPLWWRDPEGTPPAPFTQISAADVHAGHWQSTDPSAQRRSLRYLETLESTGRYPHVIWPEHCLLGDPGHNVYAPLSAALHRWEATKHTGVDFLLKGSNPWTEHYSAVRAEVPDPLDPGTEVDANFVASLANADELWIAGQALSHCVANTVRDLLAQAPFAGAADPAGSASDGSARLGSTPSGVSSRTSSGTPSGISSGISSGSHLAMTTPAASAQAPLNADRAPTSSRETSMLLLRDATSPVPGFESQARAFLEEAASRGVRIASCQELLP